MKNQGQEESRRQPSQVGPVVHLGDHEPEGEVGQGHQDRVSQQGLPEAGLEDLPARDQHPQRGPQHGEDPARGPHPQRGHGRPGAGRAPRQPPAQKEDPESAGREEILHQLPHHPEGVGVHGQVDQARVEEDGRHQPPGLALTHEGGHIPSEGDQGGDLRFEDPVPPHQPQQPGHHAEDDDPQAGRPGRFRRKLGDRGRDRGELPQTPGLVPGLGVPLDGRPKPGPAGRLGEAPALRRPEGRPAEHPRQVDEQEGQDPGPRQRGQGVPVTMEGDGPVPPAGQDLGETHGVASPLPAGDEKVEAGEDDEEQEGRLDAQARAPWRGSPHPRGSAPP